MKGVVAAFSAVVVCRGSTLPSALAVNTPTAPPPPSDPTEYFLGGAGGVEDNEQFLSWYTSGGRDKYPKSIFIPAGTDEEPEGRDGVAVLWSIDQDAETIKVAVAARATGWLGFGIAEAGGMPGSDIVLFSAAPAGAGVDADEGSVAMEIARSAPDANGALLDAHVLEGYVKPTPDDQQDWTLLNSVSEGGFLIFEAERSLDTGDPYDRPVMNDAAPGMAPHRIIAAWGDGEVSHHGSNVVKTSVFFFPRGAQFSGGLEDSFFYDNVVQEADGYFDVRNDGYVIPPRKTTYRESCFSLSYLIGNGLPADKPVHVIGVEVLVTSGKYLHHVTVFGSEVKEDLEPGDECGFGFSDDFVFGWAPGNDYYSFDPSAGLPFSATGDGYKFMRLQYHFDNRDRKEGIADFSGLRMYYTTKLRQHDVGIMQLGDPVVFLDGNFVGAGLSKHDFHCPSSCFSDFEEITVDHESLHMHETGARMVNRQFRDGKMIRQGAVDYFDFWQSGSHHVQQEQWTLKPGDSFHTTCYYDEGEKKDVVFGQGSQDEMCIAFVSYFPKQKGLQFGVCGAQWFIPKCAADYTMEEGLESVDRVFGFELPLPSGEVDGTKDPDDEQVGSEPGEKAPVSLDEHDSELSGNNNTKDPSDSDVNREESSGKDNAEDPSEPVMTETKSSGTMLKNISAEVMLLIGTTFFVF